AQTVFSNNQHTGKIQALLNNFESPDLGHIAQDINQCQSMHDRAILRDNEIGAAPLYFPEQRQSPATITYSVIQHTDISGSIPDKGEIPARQMRHDDFTGLPVWKWMALRIEDLDNDIFSSNMHAACRTFVGDKTCITSSITVRYRAAKSITDLSALIVIEPL